MSLITKERTIMSLIQHSLLCLIGLAGGIAVGSGFVAFITVLDILPRLIQMTKSQEFIRWYEFAIIFGVLFSTWLDFFDWIFDGYIWINIVIGLLMGLFVGMLAGALTEVINVLPILSRRLKIQYYLFLLVIAMALGKTMGSLFQWIFY